MGEEKNPFLIQGYIGPETFCDRRNETKTISNALLNGRNITLFSLRRMGKTGLLYHVGHHMEQKKTVKFLYSDLFNTYSTEDLARSMGQELLRVFAPKRGLARWLGSVFRSISPGISFDPLTGNPEITFNFVRPQESVKTLEHIFDFLESRKETIVWALDEFQQVGTYQKPGTEALLRSRIQKLSRTHFIFSGSHRTLLSQMFTSAKKPFYQSTQWMELQEIGRSDYRKFILKHFNTKRNRILPEMADAILDITLGHTWYVQYLCNRLYATERLVTEKLLASEMRALLKEFEPVYHNFKSLLSPFQWQVLRAVAIEERVYMPGSHVFLHRHNLGAAASVRRALDSLIQQDMISEINTGSERYYRLNDVFLMRWFQSWN